MLSNFSRPARSLFAVRPTTRLFSSNALSKEPSLRSSKGAANRDRLGLADQDKSSLDGRHGSVGSKFQPDGEIGQVGEKVGGPFAKEGAVGKQFTEQGAVGGTAQKAAEQAQGEKPGMFDKDGAVGRQFKADGNIGKIGEVVGGPFSKDGSVGKHFNPDGAVGGAVQDNLGDNKKK